MALFSVASDWYLLAQSLKKEALSEGSSPFEDVLSLQELIQEVTPDTGHEHVPDYEDMLVDA